MVNGAFFVPSGEGLDAKYAKAESVEPKSAALIDQLTLNAGVLGGPSPPGSARRPHLRLRGTWRAVNRCFDT
ncbi:hypothetical protein BHE74_00028954 [Ensete ventricosum]|nr:hypothetical protein BHE74_00028954 [Ensete ventricosum]RZS22993.1 hypothetical protein BHM03_00055834 [Ensete ventricosum]